MARLSLPPTDMDVWDAERTLRLLSEHDSVSEEDKKILLDAANLLEERINSYWEEKEN